jgi:septal ring factor EnvC (AmiA/AmiB activator)
MGGSGVGLVCAAPGGPVKSLADGLVVFADEVEQAADLAEGEADQAPGRASAARSGVLCLFLLS